MRTGRGLFLLVLVAACAVKGALPCPARADGGPVIPNPQLWAMIDEGQQIAVIRLERDGTARVDLFVSILDRSGESHQVVYFLPLGTEPADLAVTEETTRAFDEALTQPIEEQVTATRRAPSDFRNIAWGALFAGSVGAHGAWSVVAAVPVLLLKVRMGGGAPTATYETPSSQVSVYDLSPATDLDALIETTGLDPRVRETLAALRGQQIAVITLQTQPAAAGDEPGGSAAGQPGLHLGWRSSLVPGAGGDAYTYPLGTGRAWASPIELTRIYVVSPPGLDFSVTYPRLGQELSDLEGGNLGRLAWQIGTVEQPSYAVDEVYGESGHVWRAAYIGSNSAEDLVVTRLPAVSREMKRALLTARALRVGRVLVWPVCALAGLAAWLVAWRTVLPRRVGLPYRWRGGRLYKDALLWAAVYVGLLALVAGITWVLLAGDLVNCAGVALLPLAAAPLGLVNAYLYAWTRAVSLGVTRSRAFGAYLLVMLMANGVYLAFAIALGAVVSVAT